MRVRLFVIPLMLWTASPCAAETPRREIEYLVTYTEDSNARFIRSGKEYTARDGAEHMRKKLARARSRVNSAEDFINGIATKSYFTGAHYLVKLPESETVPTRIWLTQALAKHRQKARAK